MLRRMIAKLSGQTCRELIQEDAKTDSQMEKALHRGQTVMKVSSIRDYPMVKEDLPGPTEHILKASSEMG
jgi:hypothetical protein